MFKNPEEIILAILGLAWMVLTYFITSWLALGGDLAVEIISYNVAWVILAYFFWKNDRIYYSWPVFLGLFVGAWTPLLTAYAQNKAGFTPLGDNLMCVAAPWYATWYFKFGIVAALVVLGYLWLLIRNRKR